MFGAMLTPLKRRIGSKKFKKVKSLCIVGSSHAHFMCEMIDGCTQDISLILHSAHLVGLDKDNGIQWKRKKPHKIQIF